MTKSSVIFTLAGTDDGEFITVYAPGRKPLPADNSHVNFDAIKTLCLDSRKGKDVNPDEVADLFDVGETVERKFQRLTERVTVAHGAICLDGDPVHGTLQDQILDFLDKGEDFAPLVNFYEKLATNPLGNVQDGLFDWIVGQRESGPLTITPDGDVIGYKSVKQAEPEWNTGEGPVFVPSRRGEGVVNGRDVAASEYIEQRPGDVVEMPRSRVLNAPSVACGDGLHIGNYGYASTFRSGGCNTVMLVKFSPRDIVSLPDRNSTWKLRVCRYTVVGPCDGPLDTPLYLTEADKAKAEAEAAEQGLDLDLAVDGETASDTLAAGTRVSDPDGDEGTILSGPDEDGDYLIEYDDSDWGSEYWERYNLVVIDAAESGTDLDLTIGDRVTDQDGDEGTIEARPGGALRIAYDDTSIGTVPVNNGDVKDGFITAVDRDGKRIHGKGGPTSFAARGNGRNPAQDEKGRFSNGRPGSHRSGTTGRFVAQS